MNGMMNVEVTEEMFDAYHDAYSDVAFDDDASIENAERAGIAAAIKAFLAIEARKVLHCHVAGTTVGQHIDKCAKCGLDLRDGVHLRVGE